uniref:CAS_CSE1 domain-containing protein n=1 Tax=Angiostrongylus cantonensis TaxID=6313 RepID=A0A0K0DRP7_ANGCA
MHNNFRSLVARGRAANAENPGEFAPPSSRMDLMEYDCVAERYALRHVCSCDKKQSPAAYRPGYQENIHILHTTATNILGALQNLVTNPKSGIVSRMLKLLAATIFASHDSY